MSCSQLWACYEWLHYSFSLKTDSQKSNATIWVIPKSSHPHRQQHENICTGHKKPGFESGIIPKSPELRCKKSPSCKPDSTTDASQEDPDSGISVGKSLSSKSQHSRKSKLQLRQRCSTKGVQVVYYRNDLPLPFVTKVNDLDWITLKYFKEKVFVGKKGCTYRFFFKNYCEDLGMDVMEEYTNGISVLPVFLGKNNGRIVMGRIWTR